MGMFSQHKRSPPLRSTKLLNHQLVIHLIELDSLFIAKTFIAELGDILCQHSSKPPCYMYPRYTVLFLLSPYLSETRTQLADFIELFPEICFTQLKDRTSMLCYRINTGRQIVNCPLHSSGRHINSLEICERPFRERPFQMKQGLL